jgi:MerR family transcriptional regulator/heat shock protein HspR
MRQARTTNAPSAGPDEPCYVISVAARVVGVHSQTLRYYEQMGLIAPSRTGGNVRLYSAKDVERARRIKTLMEELGINLAGVEVVLRMAERMAEMEKHMHRMAEELEEARRSARPQPGARPLG